MSTIAAFCANALANMSEGDTSFTGDKWEPTEEEALSCLRQFGENIISSTFYPFATPAYAALVAKGVARVRKVRGARTWYALAA